MGPQSDRAIFAGAIFEQNAEYVAHQPVRSRLLGVHHVAFEEDRVHNFGASHMGSVSCSFFGFDFDFFVRAIVGIGELRPICPYACEKTVDEFGPCLSLNRQKRDASCSVKRFFDMLWVSAASGTLLRWDGHSETIETISPRESSFRG